MAVREPVAKFKVWFGASVSDIINPKYDWELSEDKQYICVYEKPSSKLIALRDICEYNRLNGTIEPGHKKGEIFETNNQEVEWLVKAGVAEVVK